MSMMKGIFLVLTLASNVAFSQRVTLNTDSSAIIFPNNIAVDVIKKKKEGRIVYAINERAMKTLLVHVNYLLDSRAAYQEQISISNRELSVRDSTIEVMRAQVQTADERLDVYASGYQQLKSVSATYDAQVTSLINEVRSLRKVNAKNQRKSFSKGVAAGIAGGLVIGAVILLRSD